MPFPGTWVFVSHANADFDKVRRVRDELEKRGARPLLFYLKALENNSTDLPDLLRREIAARDWFVLCESPNAAASRWVKQEVDMVLSMEGWHSRRYHSTDRLRTRSQRSRTSKSGRRCSFPTLEMTSRLPTACGRY